MRVNLERYGWVVFAITLLPRLAEACPMCASQHPGGTARIAALGVMLLLPFAVVLVVFRALRREGVLTAEENSKGRAAAEPQPSRSRAAAER